MISNSTNPAGKTRVEKNQTSVESCNWKFSCRIQSDTKGQQKVVTSKDETVIYRSEGSLTLPSRDWSGFSRFMKGLGEHYNAQ
jgi:hypothetical protein